MGSRYASLALLVQWAAATAIGVASFGLAQRLNPLVAAMAGAALVGLPQALVLRGRVRDPWGWAAVTWAGGYAALVLGFIGASLVSLVLVNGLGWFVERRVQVSDASWPVPHPWLLPILMALFWGALLAPWQVPLILVPDRPWYRQGRRWLAWGLANAVGGVVLAPILVPLVAGGGDPLPSLQANAAAGAIYGVATGVTLAAMLRQHREVATRSIPVSEPA